MTNGASVLRGIVHGNMIEVQAGIDLPEGQEVTIIVQPLVSAEEVLRRSAGGWADDPEGVDRFVEEMRRLRSLERPEAGE